MIKDRTKKAIDKFLAEYKEAVDKVYGGDIDSALAEDVSTYYKIDVTVMKTKIRFATTYIGICGDTYFESIDDDDEAREQLKQWKADFRRARRYWATDSDTLDKMADGEIEDEEE